MTTGKPQTDPRQAHLLDLNGPNKGRRTDLTASCTVVGLEPGRRGLQVERTNAFMGSSRTHLEIRRNGTDYLLRDVGTHGQGSTYGTFVNGSQVTPLTYHKLENGDRIRLGRIGGKLFEFVGPKDAETFIREYRRSDIVVDLSRYDVRIRDQSLDPPLSPLELNIMKVLHDNCGQVVTRQQLWTTAWRESPDTYTYMPVNRAVQRLGLRLKQELGLDSSLIKAVRGVGYMLDLE